MCGEDELEYDELALTQMMLRMRKNLEMQLEQQPQDHSANATDSNASMTDGRGTNTQPIITAEI